MKHLAITLVLSAALPLLAPLAAAAGGAGTHSGHDGFSQGAGRPQTCAADPRIGACTLVLSPEPGPYRP